MTGKQKAGIGASVAAAAVVTLLVVTSGDDRCYACLKRAMVESVTAYRASAVDAAYAPGRPVDETFRAPRYAFVRIEDPGDAIKWEVLRSPSLNISRTFWRANYIAADGSVTLPVAIDGPIENQRVQVFATNAAGVSTLLQPPIKLTDLPAWGQVQ